MFLTKDSKSPFYQLVYFVDGKRTKISTKTHDLAQAEKFKKFFIPPTERKEPAQKEVTIVLSKFAEEYKAFVKSTYSKAYYERAVVPSLNKLSAFLPDLPLNLISSRNIDQFISSIITKSKSAASLYHRTLKAAFNKAIAWNYIKENPFNKIKAPKVVKSYPLFITQIELHKILTFVKYDFLKDIYKVSFFTGMRIGEILNMKWGWVDFSQNIITVKNSDEFTTKGKKERIIPMNPAVQTVLKKRLTTLDKNDFVFYRFPGIKLNENFGSGLISFNHLIIKNRY